MDTCGCRYEPILGPQGQHIGGNIIYCLEHAAAPEMHRVLNSILIWLQTDQGSGKNLTYKPPWVDALVAVIQAAGDEDAS